MEEQKKGPAIGIDLGSAYTRVAVYDGSNCRMIPDQHGNYAMPSYVAFTASGVLVGEAARSQGLQNPANTIFDVIRLIGRRYSDPLILRSKMRLWPFKVRAGPGDRLLVEVQWKRKLWHFTPVEICSMILMQIKENAEINLGATITDAVITVPGHYNYEQRQAIKQAGMIAGLNFMKIITSPAASAYFYSTERLSKSSSMVTNITRNIFTTEPKEYNMIIFDLGAGTLDVALVAIKDGECKVQAAAGDLHLGGTDFDNNMVDHFVDLLNKRGIKRINNISMAMCNLRTSCEKAKISLSSGNVWVPLKITPLYDNVNFESSITNAEFEELNNEPLLKCIRIIDTCLTDAKISINEVHEVILAGGSARIPHLQFSVRRYFKRKELNVSQNLETATAYGAAFQAFFLATRGMGRVSQLSLFDVIPFPLGFQSFQGEMVVCIPKNTAIPTKIEKTFRSFHSDRKSFLFEVYEGEDTLTNQDYLLGKFELCTPHISPNGSDINVCFEIDENGTLIVTAEELSSGMRNNITITSNNIEDSQRRVWEALLYNEGEKGINKASTTKSSAQTDPSTICIGIDFGTTYSCVAVWQQNDVKIIENEYMSCVTRSAVSFTETGRFIGDSAITEEVLTSPESTISNIKHLIGTWCSDQSLENVRGVVRGKNNRAMVSVRYKGENKKFALEEVASMILSKMKEIAEAHVSSKITHAVISIPACFRDSQRKAIQDAAVIAGLNVMQLLNETTAAAIAYFVKKVGGGSCGEKTLLVFDLGGGYLDVSIVTISGSIIKVQAVVSDTNLGGEDFDNNMVIHFVAKFLQEKKRDISNKPRSLRRLRAACEKAKKILSRYTKTTIEIDAFDDGIDFSTTITREFFEKLNLSLFLRCIECVKKCLRDAKLDKICIDEVVLVGGSTRIPKVQRLLQEFFNGKELCKSLDLDETVAYGAAVRAAILCGNKDIKKLSGLKVQDVTSCSFWLEGLGGAMNLLIPKSTPIPAKKELLFSTCLDNLTSITLKIHDCEFASSTVFTLSGIPPKQRGNSKINVSVEVDHNGILDLTAKDMSSMWRNEIEICKENEGLTKEEVQQMVKMAACYKAEDEEAKVRAAALNSLENFAYKLKAMARDGGVSGSSKKMVEEAAQGAIGWLETNYNASIDEIIAWNKHLETIKSRIVYLGTPARAQ